MADLPIKLQSALETLVSGYAKEKLEKDARAISEAYRLRTGEGKRLLTAEGEAAAYAAARMPATYAAAYFALSEAIEASGLHPETMLDCGAGTGAATFAADSLLELKEATCLEREAAMRTVGEKLTRQACGVQPRWDAMRFDGERGSAAGGTGLRGLYAWRAGSGHAPERRRKALERLRADARAD